MKPRASMPTTASTEPGAKFSVSRSIEPANRCGSASTGVMSLNWMPGLGKSGTLRMACSISWAVTVGMMSVLFNFRFLEFLDHFAELSQRQVLDLAHAFAGDAKFLADFLQRFFRTAVETKAEAQNRRLTLVEMLDHVLQHVGDGFVFEVFVRGSAVLVLHHVGKII